MFTGIYFKPCLCSAEDILLTAGDILQMQRKIKFLSNQIWTVWFIRMFGQGLLYETDTVKIAVFPSR